MKVVIYGKQATGKTIVGNALRDAGYDVEETNMNLTIDEINALVKRCTIVLEAKGVEK